MVSTRGGCARTKLPDVGRKAGKKALLLEGGNRMDGAIAGVFPFVFPKQRKRTGEKSVLKEIELVRLELESAAARYEFLNDPDLVEACIYEMKALSARHRYLLGEAKRDGLKAEGNVGSVRTTRL